MGTVPWQNQKLHNKFNMLRKVRHFKPRLHTFGSNLLTCYLLASYPPRLQAAATHCSVHTPHPGGRHGSGPAVLASAYVSEAGRVAVALAQLAEEDAHRERRDAEVPLLLEVEVDLRA